MLLRDVEAPDVVEGAVVALADQGVDGACGAPDVGIAGHGVFHQGGVGGAHAEGVGEDDGGLDGAQLLHLDEPGGLAEAVDDRRGGEDLVPEEVPLVGQHGGDAGVHVSAVPDGDVAHGDAGDVGDEVPGPRGASADPKTR